MTEAERQKLIALQMRFDPLLFADRFWPHVCFFDKQIEIIQSVAKNPETWVHAANMVGKDFVAGFIIVHYFVTYHPVRVVSTSVKDDHLRVLWGEVNRFIATAKYPLDAKKGGPLVVNHREIKKIVDGRVDPVSYCIGQVSEKGEGMAGHHAPFALAVVDEASSMDDDVYDKMSGWMKRFLGFGNPNPPAVGATKFHAAVKGGDVYAKED